MAQIRIGNQVSLRMAMSLGCVAFIFSIVYSGTTCAATRAEALLDGDDVNAMANTLREHPELLHDIGFIQRACANSRQSPYFKFKNARAYFLGEFAKADGTANLEDQDGSTPLMWCVKTDDIKLLKALLQQGADIKHTSRKPVFEKKVIVSYASQGGMSVLHWANNWSKLSTIEFLLKQGADPELGKDSLNMSPMEQASIYNLQNGAIARLYRKFLKDPGRYSQPESFVLFKGEMLKAAEKKDKNAVYAHVDNDYKIERDFGVFDRPGAGGVSNFSIDFQFDNSKLGKEFKDHGWHKFEDMLKGRVVVLATSICFVKRYKEPVDDPTRMCVRQNGEGVWMFYKYDRGGD